MVSHGRVAHPAGARGRRGGTGSARGRDRREQRHAVRRSAVPGARRPARPRGRLLRRDRARRRRARPRDPLPGRGAGARRGAAGHVRALARRGARVSQQHPRRPQCRLPTAAEYERAFLAFRERFPHVRTYAPWNEPNHRTQPTWNTPETAARFTNIAARHCEGCTIVVGDLLDQADNRLARRPTYRATTRWVQRYRAALRTPRDVCGIHNYSDVNRFRTAGTRALMRALGCRRYWLTETGGIMSVGRLAARRRAPDARDRVPVPARRARAADRARVRVHVVRARDAAVGLRARRAARGRDDDARPALEIVREHVQAGAPRRPRSGRRSRRWRARRCGPGPRPRPPRGTSRTRWPPRSPPGAAASRRRC